MKLNGQAAAGLSIETRQEPISYIEYNLERLSTYLLSLVTRLVVLLIKPRQEIRDDLLQFCITLVSKLAILSDFFQEFLLR